MVAAILADALGEDEFEQLANLLDRDVEVIEKWVARRNVGECTYWVCAFSVDQHAGICAGNPHDDTDPVTGTIHGTCSCGAPKYFNDSEPLRDQRSVKCEMNKFDEMMACYAASSGSLLLQRIPRVFVI